MLLSVMFDFDKFLKANWPDPQHLANFVWGYGYRELTLDALRKWYRRATVPAEWLPVLLTLLEIEKGRPIMLAPYLKPRKQAA